MTTVEIHYDAAKRILCGRMRGQPSLEGFKAALEQITSSESFPPDTRTLWDLRELDFTEIDRGMEEELIAIRRHFPERQSARLALVVADDLGLGMARMYEILTDQEPGLTRVFKSRSEAEDWLLER